jgi:hypothetical protein
MGTLTHDDVIRLVPGIQDHTAVEILDTKASVSELEAALLLLQDTDEGLTGIKGRESDQINRLLAILSKSEVRPAEDDR